MAELVASGRLIDLIIGFTVLEILALWLYHRATGRGVPLPAMLPNLMAGLFLMLAVRAATAQAAWPWVVLPLMGSGLAHVLDLRRRWPSA